MCHMDNCDKYARIRNFSFINVVVLFAKKPLETSYNPSRYCPLSSYCIQILPKKLCSKDNDSNTILEHGMVS